MADPALHRASSSSVDTAPPTGSEDTAPPTIGMDTAPPTTSVDAAPPTTSMDAAPPTGSTEQRPVRTLMELHQQASADQKQPSLEHADNWDDWGGYMQAKRRKLHEQFQDTGSARRSSIFSGVTIYVNGWTQPDADELKRLMHAHGGSYVYNAYPGARITHVIATNLPNVKVRALGDTLVCTPQWVVDSIAAGKQLPVHEYLLYSRDGAGQGKLNFKRCQRTNGLMEEVGDDGRSTAATLEQISPSPAAESLLEFAAPDDRVREGVINSTEHTEGQNVPPPPVVPVNEHPKHSSSTPVHVPKAMPYKPARGSDFINEFYTHSRLHHLSTWSSELKQFTSRTLPHVMPKYPKLTASLRSLGQRAVVHVDLDCFFVSVSIRDKPHLRGRPVAVAHAKLPKNDGAERLANPPPNASNSLAASRAAADVNQNATSLEQQMSESCATDLSTLSDAVHLPSHLQESMSDVASCSYEARKAGVCNGMQVGTALKRCPDLTILPYQFDRYRQVSQEFYETMMRYSAVIEAVSCDEAYVELTDYADSIEGVERIVRELRDEVRDKTGCSVSAGISHNMLLARMCTRVAKPNGQFRLPPDRVDEFLAPQKVQNLPGVGYSLTRRLQEMGLQTCGDVRALTLGKLQSECGTKTGRMLHDYTRGIDARELKIDAERKSVSADINFGIRFSDISEAESLIADLATEVEKRAEEARVLAGTVTLKLKIRRPGAPVEARKYLGHGSCDNTSRSCTLLQPTRSSSEIARIAGKLLRQIRPVASDVRGVGLQLTKLVSSEMESQPSSAHALGTDLRVLFKGKEATRSTNHEPPLPSLAVQPVERGLCPTAQQGSSSGSACSLGATPGARLCPGATLSPQPEMDDSFAVELPPASQLDSSVLEALPASLRRRILNGYQRQAPPSSSALSAARVTTPTSRQSAIATSNPNHVLPEIEAFHPPPVVNIRAGTPELNPARGELASGLLCSKPRGIPTGDESAFLSEHRAYLKGWVTHFLDGPDDSDLQKVTVYLTDLARRNLEVIYVLLKYFRRLVLNLDPCRWYSVFNFLLQKLQAEIRHQYGIVKTMTAKKKAKSKSTKDKSRNQVVQTGLDISRPAVGGEGLYIKLTHHQKSISAHMKFITTALENGLHKTDLTTVVTKLLVEVDCAVTTTHQCFTREVFDRNISLKPRLERSKKTMFQNVATLVRWADFTSKEQYIYPNQEEGSIVGCIRDFETALHEIVKLVSEIQKALSHSGSEAFQRVRRSSLDEGTVHSVTSPMDVPHPQLAALRGESKDRKTSWSPGMGPSSPSRSLGVGSPYRDKVLSLRPGMLRDSLLSVQSDHSSTSDEEKRRSGSAERYIIGQHSPEHSHDWESRLRSHTTPLEPYRGGPLPVPVPAPTIPATYDLARELPPLPGDNKEEPPPPPLPRKPVQFDRNSTRQPPIPARKGHTLPRASSTSVSSESPLLNGRWSPPDFTGTTEAKPPPIPAKQRKHQHPSKQVMNGHASQARQEDYDVVPPPLPTKQRRAAAMTTSVSVTSPSHSPSHTPSHAPTHTPTHAPVRSAVSVDHGRATAPDQVARIGVPPVPVRIESIPGLKNALETPPPKPPRTDRPVNVELPTPPPQTQQDKVVSAINAVRKYNEDIIKGTIGPDAKPPLPLKKKTIIMYKEMIHGYKFDDTIMQPLYIPGMAEPPPPIPPKKRTRRRQASQEQGAVRAAAEGGRGKGGGHRKQDSTLGSELSASTDDLYNEDIDVDDRDVNYLECEESSGYLIFNREESGGYTLRGGPVDALIAYAASTTNAVKHFSEAFLLTYYTFITPEELISRLLYRLDCFYKQGHSAVWTATTSLLVRVLTSLNQPLVKAAEVKLIDMVHQMLTDGNLKFAQLLRNSLVTKLNQLIPDQTKTIPIGKALSSPNRKLNILEFQTDDIARQMTVLDNELFQKVDVAEMLYWAAEQNEDKSPQLTQFTMHFNNVSQWTKTRLLDRGMDVKTRVKLMLHFITIMKCLRENYNNFNSYLAILSAIESSPISRLDWPDRVIKGLEEPRALIDNRGSFKNYREAFAQAKPPCIPYIGLYLQDLTFIEMQPSHLEQDKSSINFTKRWKQFKSVDHIRFAQTRQYSFDPDPDILSLFSNFEVYLSDEELWVISNEIKPSARAQRPPQQTAQ